MVDCHSERSEESERVDGAGLPSGFLAPLGMTWGMNG